MVSCLEKKEVDFVGQATPVEEVSRLATVSATIQVRRTLLPVDTPYAGPSEIDVSFACAWPSLRLG